MSGVLSSEGHSGATARGSRADRLRLRVRSVAPQGECINAYELVDEQGRQLPEFEPGSHIDVFLADEGLGARQYSLCGDPEDRYRYVIAVQREDAGRGGSRTLFDQLRAGSLVTVSRPRNNFPIAQDAQRHLLLAGGIGITPIISMLYELRRRKAEFTLHYCARSKSRTPFVDLLEPLAQAGWATLYWDGGDPAKGLDVARLLQGHEPGTHLYYCGPPGLMRAVAAASAHWPAGTTHCELFAPLGEGHANSAQPQGQVSTGETGEGTGFEIRIASTGQTYFVPADKSILEVLNEHGIEIESSCALGVCGTCRTRYLEGEPDHRDFVLDPLEQASELTVCCSRSKSALLVLDL